jgi:hypothetical protein
MKCERSGRFSFAIFKGQSSNCYFPFRLIPILTFTVNKRLKSVSKADSECV